MSSGQCVKRRPSDKKIETVPALSEKKNEHTSGRKHKLNRIDTLEPFQHKIKKQCKTVRVSKIKEDQQTVVLLHGLNRLSYDFDTIKQVLQQKFPYAQIVALTSVNKDPSRKGMRYRSPTVKLPIKAQAELAYEEIKTHIGRGKHVVLVGHSQGGLRGFTIIREYGYRLKKEVGITIDQLITIGTPWKGAAVMDHFKNPNKVNKKLDEVQDTLEKIKSGYRKDLVRHFFKAGTELAKWVPALCKHADKISLFSKRCLGVIDLTPGGDFIRHYVASGLKEINVPITAIAGVLTDFSKLFETFQSSINSKALARLNHTYAELIGGDATCEHDMLLPVGTQLAEGLEKKDFNCIKISGACHGNKVGISVKKGIPELNNKAVIQAVVECIEKTFYQEQQIEEVVIEKEVEEEGAVEVN